MLNPLLCDVLNCPHDSLLGVGYGDGKLTAVPCVLAGLDKSRSKILQHHHLVLLFIGKLPILVPHSVVSCAIV